MRIKRSLRVGTASLPDGFAELLKTSTRAELLLQLCTLRHREIAEPVRYRYYFCNFCDE